MDPKPRKKGRPAIADGKSRQLQVRFSLEQLEWLKLRWERTGDTMGQQLRDFVDEARRREA